MTKQIRPSRSAVTLLFFALAGCGGGGGGGGGGGLTPPPSTPVAITQQNQQQVSGTSLNSAEGGSDALGTASTVQVTAPSRPRAVTRTLQSVVRHAKEPQTASRTVAGVDQQSAPCAVSGSVSVSGGGSSATIAFNACSDTAGETLNGTISTSGASAASDGSSFSAAISMDVTLTEPGQSLRVVGSFSISQTCNTTTGDCSSTFSGSSLGATDGTNTFFLTNFSIEESLLSGTVTLSVNYTLSSTRLNGAVTVATNPANKFQMFTSEQHPHSGQMTITGAGSARLTVTVNGSDPTAADQVTVLFDQDGDGNPESTTKYSWSQLTA